MHTVVCVCVFVCVRGCDSLGICGRTCGDVCVHRSVVSKKDTFNVAPPAPPRGRELAKCSLCEKCWMIWLKALAPREVCKQFVVVCVCVVSHARLSYILKNTEQQIRVTNEVLSFPRLCLSLCSTLSSSERPHIVPCLFRLFGSWQSDGRGADKIGLDWSCRGKAKQKALLPSRGIVTTKKTLLSGCIRMEVGALLGSFICWNYPPAICMSVCVCVCAEELGFVRSSNRLTRAVW